MEMMIKPLKVNISHRLLLNLSNTLTGLPWIRASLVSSKPKKANPSHRSNEYYYI